jgi:hypothetical protein
MPGGPSEVFDYGPLGARIAAALKVHAGESFDRIFYTPRFPNVALWREGIDLVVVIESARANYFAVKDSSRPDGVFYGWEVVVVAGVYTIDGQPLGYHDSAREIRQAFYRTEVVGPPYLEAGRREAEGEQVKRQCQGDQIPCAIAVDRMLNAQLGDAVDVAISQVLRRFPVAEAQRYIDRRFAEVAVGYGRYLEHKDEDEYVRSLRASGRKIAAGMTPSTPAPTTERVKWTVQLMRNAAQLSALGSALSTSMAQNYQRMGMYDRAASSASLARLQSQNAERGFAELARSGYGGMDRTTRTLLTLLGGVASYSEYRMQRHMEVGTMGDPRSCPAVLALVDRALEAKAAATSGARSAPEQAYREIYKAYCS